MSIVSNAENKWTTHYEVDGGSPAFGLIDYRESAGCQGEDNNGDVVFIIHGGILDHSRIESEEIREAIADGEPHDAFLKLKLKAPPIGPRTSSYVDEDPEFLASPDSRPVLNPEGETGFFPYSGQEWFGKRAGHSMVSVPELNSCFSLGGYSSGGVLLPMDVRQYKFKQPET